ARGTQTRAAVESINARLRALLPALGEVLVCYHDDPDGCACRKPRPGMLLEAARRRGLDLRRSFVVGDRWSDVAAGHAAGWRAVLTETPSTRPGRGRPAHTAAALAGAVDWILRVSAEESDEAVR